MFGRRPKTPEALRAQIADLSRRRAVLLRDAPAAVARARARTPILLGVLASIFALALLRNSMTPGTGVFVVASLAFVLGWASYRLWRPGLKPGDLWGAAGRLDDDGQGPHELQRKIEALEAELRERR